MTRKDEIKPAPVAVELQNGKENIKKNYEHHETTEIKETLFLPKTNIQRASDQKRYYWMDHFEAKLQGSTPCHSNSYPN